MDRSSYPEFIEASGDMMSEHGMPQMAGRVIGALLVCVPPQLSLDELAEDLQASKGSISMATQFLLRMGFIERISLPGKRRRYYRVRGNFWEELLAVQTEHMLEHRKLFTQGLEILRDEPVEMKRRLVEFNAYMDFIMEEIPDLNQRWAKQRSPLIQQRMKELSKEGGGE